MDKITISRLKNHCHKEWKEPIVVRVTIPAMGQLYRWDNLIDRNKIKVEARLT